MYLTLGSCALGGVKSSEILFDPVDVRADELSELFVVDDSMRKLINAIVKDGAAMKFGEASGKIIVGDFGVVLIAVIPTFTNGTKSRVVLVKYLTSDDTVAYEPVSWEKIKLYTIKNGKVERKVVKLDKSVNLCNMCACPCTFYLIAPIAPLANTFGITFDLYQN